MVENRFSSSIKQLQINGGGEFTSKLFLTFLRDHGISHQISSPYTPQQNGVVEMKHQHIVAMGLCLLAQSRLPHNFWVEAFSTAVFLINRLPTPQLGHLSPYEKLLQRPPDYTSLKSFGCTCFPHMVPYNKHKLSFKSVPCVFIGYDDHYKGYRCLDPISGRVYISRNVTFDETTFPYRQPQIAPDAQPTFDAHSDLGPNSFSHRISTSTGPPQSDPIPLASPQINPSPSPAHNDPIRSPYAPADPVPSSPSQNSLPSPLVSLPSSHPTNPAISPLPTLLPTDSTSIPDTANPSPPPTPPSSPIPHTTTSSPASTPPSSPLDPSIFPNSPNTPNHPQHFKSLKSIVPFGPVTKPLYSPTHPHPLPHGLSATCSDPTSIEPTSFTQASKYSHWQDAMKDEYDALMKNQTWSLVPATSRMNVVGCKWVFKVKRKADGSVDRYKARLVAKGFNQQEGFDYEETFSPVVKPATIRTILSLALSYHWSLQQLDVRNAFLNRYLQEEVYMKQPPGFHDPSRPQAVCRLHKALYGLKQAPRTWFQRLSTFLLAQGFVHSHSDASLFIRLSSSCTVYVLVYVDDIIVTGSDPQNVHQFLDQLCSTFDSRHMGELNFFLGMEITRFPDHLFLSQTRYAIDLLKRFNMTDCKPCPTPLPSDTRLSCLDGDPLSDPSTYRSMVGGLQYLTLSRPDISFAVNQVCQFMHNPRSSHLQVVKRIFRYIKGTVAQGLVFHESTDFTLRSFPS
ncbi:hypothetical protein L3X38_011620 [Prunus dulcis]|uniref:Integrase catalytic domain-containing protein n=1 Tax=Prunus dulcis TaxID=3755 RepID=A0AAD4WJE6_PRUDU|nr:hypothetical protein L3X38_011620 [Prunus dulcis]